MKKSIHLLALFMALVLSLHANSSSFQQSADNEVAKAILPGEAAYSVSREHDPYVDINKTGSGIYHDSTLNPFDNRYKSAVGRLRRQAAAIREYAKANHFNSNY